MGNEKHELGALHYKHNNLSVHNWLSTHQGITQESFCSSVLHYTIVNIPGMAWTMHSNGMTAETIAFTPPFHIVHGVFICTSFSVHAPLQ